MASGKNEGILALVSKSLDGDSEAMEQLLVAVDPHIEATVRSFDDPDDALQEARMAILTKLSDFRKDTDAEFVAWCKRIAYTKAIDLTRVKRPVVGGSGLQDALGALAAHDTTQRTTAERSERKSILLEELDKLNDRQAAAIRLCHFEHLNWTDIAARLRISKAAAKQLEQRGCANLLTSLQQRLGTS
jgi:RNA polymerase sigma factor (sigma-70 family)